jgi:hypothetical protein
MVEWVGAEAPVDRVRVTKLSGVDGFAARSPGTSAAGPTTLVHVNEDLPVSVQHSVEGELLRRVHCSEDPWATADLAAGEGASIPRQRGLVSARR